MVESRSEATDSYRKGINRIGVDAYQQASRADTPKEAAETLEDAKAETLNLSDMADAYSDAYA
ncbi:MAG: hypothetical protein ABEJ66_01030 [Candidatus Nanohaloarchaea archaeon]